MTRFITFMFHAIDCPGNLINEILIVTWHLKSPTPRPFVQQFGAANSKENIKLVSRSPSSSKDVLLLKATDIPRICNQAYQNHYFLSEAVTLTFDQLYQKVNQLGALFQIWEQSIQCI